MLLKYAIVILFVCFFDVLHAVNSVSLNVQNADIGQTIPSTMHGLILETNINRDDDGGLYAELIYNRAFQGLKYHRYM